MYEITEQIPNMPAKVIATFATKADAQAYLYERHSKLSHHNHRLILVDRTVVEVAPCGLLPNRDKIDFPSEGLTEEETEDWLATYSAFCD